MEHAAPAVRATFDGILFDMDGTVIDSTEAVVKYWHDLAREIGADPEVILQTSHGMRSIDTLKVFAPEKANWDYVRRMEGLIPKLYGSSVVEIPGAHSLVQQVMESGVPWSIVTSGTLPLVSGWLERLGIPKPEHLVTAESVANGKPDPGCYLLGRERIGLPAKQANGGHANNNPDEPSVLVLEDSTAGIKSGKAAGCKVLSVVTTHTAEQVLGAGPDWIVKNLESVKVVEAKGGKVTLEISNALTATKN